MDRSTELDSLVVYVAQDCTGAEYSVFFPDHHIQACLMNISFQIYSFPLHSYNQLHSYLEVFPLDVGD